MLLLCVDDDQDDLTLFREAMETIRKGTVLTVAENGVQALELLSTLKPDLIFLDINMPVMNGEETLRQIRLNPRLNRIPVCMFSTFISNDQHRLYLQMGAVCCLIKPNSFDALCKILKLFFDERTGQAA